MLTILRKILPLAALLLLGACAGKAPPAGSPPLLESERVAELARAINTRGDAVEPREARRAASLAFSYGRQLARDYGVTGSALMHNIKVNLGLRSRGLCVHYTRDLLTRLQQEKFHSLDLHWGIANYDRIFRIEHSTVIISARGATLRDGIVLDPWRHGGDLFWSPTLEDSEYQWQPWAEIMALKKEFEVGIDER